MLIHYGCKNGKIAMLLFLLGIMNSVSKELFEGIVYTTSVKLVWSDLNEFEKIKGSQTFVYISNRNSYPRNIYIRLL